MSPAEVVTQFSDLIHKMAWGCARRLPPTSTLSHDDLYQEGALHVYLKAHMHNPARGKMITFLTHILTNKFSKIIKTEWRRRGRVLSIEMDVAPSLLVIKPEQRRIELIWDLESTLSQKHVDALYAKVTPSKLVAVVRDVEAGLEVSRERLVNFRRRGPRRLQTECGMEAVAA